MDALVAQFFCMIACLLLSWRRERRKITKMQKELNAGVAWNEAWVGDVWKAILKLRAQHSDLETCVLNCDHGIGLVYRAQNRSGLSLTSEQIDAMAYSDFAGDALRLLGLRTPRHLIEVLGKLRLKPR